MVCYCAVNIWAQFDHVVSLVFVCHISPDITAKRLVLPKGRMFLTQKQGALKTIYLLCITQQHIFAMQKRFSIEQWKPNPANPKRRNTQQDK